MTFGELWAMLTLKQPKLLDDGAKVELTVKQFKSQLSQAYDTGADHVAKQSDDRKPRDIFDIFGGLR